MRRAFINKSIHAFNKIQLTCKTLFLKSNCDIFAEAVIGLVLVKKINQSTKLIRNLTEQVKDTLSILEAGPKI